MKREILFSITVLLLLPATSLSEDRWWELKMSDERFSYSSFTNTVAVTQKHLKAFRDLSELLLDNSDVPQTITSFAQMEADEEIRIELIGKDLLRFSASLDWAQQNIGFANMITVINGHGLISRNEMLRLRIENLQLKGAKQADIDTLQASLEKAEAALKTFLSKQKWSD